MLQALKNKSRRIASTFAAGVLLFSQFAVVPTASAHSTNNNEPVNICHASNSQSNPYTTNSIDKSSIDNVGNQYLNGHGDHTGPTWYPGIADHSWGDIIPAFTNAAGHSFAGQNWDAAGQAIYNNSCSTKNTIKIVKDAQPNSSTNFGFEIDKQNSSWDDDFSLRDDGNDPNGTEKSETYDGLSAGVYDITEDGESDWVLNSVSCNTENYTVNLANKKATVTVGVAENITCTFVNVPAPTYGSVKVNKKVDNGNGSYTSANGSQYPFRWGLDSEDTDNLMGSTQSSVLTGSHQVNENVVNGYEFVGWYYTADEDNEGQHQTNCKYPQGTTFPVNITVEKSKTKELTFCNKIKKGSITIVKDAQPNSDNDFSFNINQAGEGLYNNFQLEDNGNENDGLKSYKSFDNLYADDYVVTEQSEEGWVLSDITCSEGATVTIDKENGKVTITLGTGENVTCTFTNQKKGTITVNKHTSPAGDKTGFEIEATTENGTIYGDDTATVYDGSNTTFSVGYGTYSVSELLPEGWAQTGNTCENIVISVENLDAVCDIYNTKEAKLTVYKYTSPYQDPQDFTFTSEQLGSFTLDNDNDPTLDNNKAFTGLTAGEYSITEETVDNWVLAYAYCYNGENYLGNLDDATLTVNLNAGDDIDCYFYNVKQNTITGHKFNDINGNHEWDENEPGLANWTITLTKECDAEQEVSRLLNIQIDENEGDCEAVTDSTVTDATGAYAFTDLEPGTYTVCEVQKATWTQTYPQTKDGCHEIVIEGDGEVVTADFGNKAKPQVLSETTTQQLVNTGASTGKGMAIGLTILSILGALHILTNRRKDYAL